ncbi:hypothetical protein [Streptomyces sp. TLI_105]|uniref:hypothetical protein n=1 Tax=Streptomyces sp. TLI_105 TaxID=1881019 RepID=UPI0015A5E601|nr:hypothetical protein [Streptomyces sp. TLI_105]
MAGTLGTAYVLRSGGADATRSTPAPQDQDTDGFVTARTSSPAVGTGTIRRFKVRVERGTGLSAEQAAREVYEILVDRRSWTADGHNGCEPNAWPYDTHRRYLGDPKAS